MECRITLSRPWRAALILAGLVLALPARAADALVLVVPARSPIQSLDSLQVRKAFVGLSVTVDGGTIVPLINNSQESLRAAFLQHVVGLSEQMYRRRTLTLALQQGRASPVVHDRQAELLRSLEANPYSVTYMWQSTVAGLDQVRVVRVLWRD
jgi:hypothetical protein